MKKTSGSKKVRGVPPYMLETPSVEEITAVVAEAKNQPGGAEVSDVVLILLHTGLRQRELCELRWKNVNFEERYLAVRTGKTSGTRRVPLANVVSQIFAARREQGPEAEFVLGSEPERLLDRVASKVRLLSEQVCRRSFNLHALRHAFGTRWVNAGGDIASLAYIMGHKSVNSTFKTLIPREQLPKIAARHLAAIEG